MNPVLDTMAFGFAQAGDRESLAVTAGLVLGLLVLVALVYQIGWGKSAGPRRLGAVLLLAAALGLGFPPPRPFLTKAFEEKAPEYPTATQRPVRPGGLSPEQEKDWVARNRAWETSTQQSKLDWEKRRHDWEQQKGPALRRTSWVLCALAGACLAGAGLLVRRKAVPLPQDEVVATREPARPKTLRSYLPDSRHFRENWRTFTSYPITEQFVKGNIRTTRYNQRLSQDHTLATPLLWVFINPYVLLMAFTAGLGAGAILGFGCWLVSLYLVHVVEVCSQQTFWYWCGPICVLIAYLVSVRGAIACLMMAQARRDRSDAGMGLHIENRSFADLLFPNKD